MLGSYQMRHLIGQRINASIQAKPLCLASLSLHERIVGLPLTSIYFRKIVSRRILCTAPLLVINTLITVSNAIPRLKGHLCKA